MEKKGVLTVGYDGQTGQKIIKLSPTIYDVAVTNAVAEEVPQYQGDEPQVLIELEAEGEDAKPKRKIVKRTNKELIEIGDHLVSIIMAHDKIKSTDLYKEMTSKFGNYHLARYTMDNCLCKLVEAGKIKNLANSNAMKVFAAIDKAPPFDGSINIPFSIKDYDLLQASMQELNIGGNPKDWIYHLVTIAALNLMDKKVPSGITFPEELWKKYQQVEEDMREREERNLSNILYFMIKDYIDKEYDERNVFTSIKKMIGESKDPRVLGELKNIIASRLTVVATEAR
jgi:hypothetical protein